MAAVNNTKIDSIYIITLFLLPFSVFEARVKQFDFTATVLLNTFDIYIFFVFSVLIKLSRPCGWPDNTQWVKAGGCTLFNRFFFFTLLHSFIAPHPLCPLQAVWHWQVCCQVEHRKHQQSSNSQDISFWELGHFKKYSLDSPQNDTDRFFKCSKK